MNWKLFWQYDSLFMCTTTTRFGLKQNSKIHNLQKYKATQTNSCSRSFIWTIYFFSCLFSPSESWKLHRSSPAERSATDRWWHQGVLRLCVHLLKFTQLEGIKKSTQHNKTLSRFWKSRWGVCDFRGEVEGFESRKRWEEVSKNQRNKSKLSFCLSTERERQCS